MKTFNASLWSFLHLNYTYFHYSLAEGISNSDGYKDRLCFHLNHGCINISIKTQADNGIIETARRRCTY
jgi:hypothetical protein